MTVADHYLAADSTQEPTAFATPTQRGAHERGAYDVPRVEPLAALDWYTAVELPDSLAVPMNPAQRRRAWVHRAPERRVLERYREAGGLGSDLAAPWWLRALAAGDLNSRLGGFAVEDAITELLDSRSGWEYVPWVDDSESGYWEYLPSEQGGLRSTVPTTLTMTDRHPGWIDVVPAHTGQTPEPIPINGPAELRARIETIESLVASPDT